jgi:hypothetical protein
MNKTIVIITGIIVAGLLIGYYLYLNKAGNVAKPSLKVDTQLLELVKSSAYHRNSKSTVMETIDSKLHLLKGDFKVIGWETKRIDEQTILASYMYKKNGEVLGWFFEVKSGRIIRDVTSDYKLMKKYNVVNRTVFTREDVDEHNALIEKGVEIGMNKTGLPLMRGSPSRYDSSSDGKYIYTSDAYTYLSSDEQKILENLSRRRAEHNEGIYMLKRE